MINSLYLLPPHQYPLLLPKIALSLTKLKLKETKYIKLAREIHGDKYQYHLVNCIDILQKVAIVCPKHGIFYQSFHHHIYRKQHCSQCIGNKKLTTIQFIEKAKKIHGNKYDYSKTIYERAKKEVIIICPKHGEFFKSPTLHINKKQGCQTCAHSLSSEETFKNFKKLLNRLKLNNKENFYKLDFSLSQYINLYTPMTIYCKKHGNFRKSPNNLLRYCCCPKCSRESLRKTTEHFIQQAQEIHGNKYNYSKTIYKNINNKVIIICPKHGEFLQSPHSHIISKCGCQKCCLSKGENKIKNILDDNKILYYQQYIFKNCKNPKTNGRLRFDFYIPEQNILIEFNGLQHYKEVANWNTPGQTLEYRQYCDSIKEKYAQDHNINLLIIKYNENIEDKLKTYLNLV